MFSKIKTTHEIVILESATFLRCNERETFFFLKVDLIEYLGPQVNFNKYARTEIILCMFSITTQWN